MSWTEPQSLQDTKASRNGVRQFHKDQKWLTDEQLLFGACTAAHALLTSAVYWLYTCIDFYLLLRWWTLNTTPSNEGLVAPPSLTFHLILVLATFCFVVYYVLHRICHYLVAILAFCPVGMEPDERSPLFWYFQYLLHVWVMGHSNCSHMVIASQNTTIYKHWESCFWV